MYMVEIGTVLEQYGLSKELMPIPLAGGTANQNYVIRSCDDPYVLRIRNDNYSSDLWLKFEEEYLQFIYGQGLPVPLPIPNLSGQSWTKHCDKVYQLSRFIDGSKFTNKNLEIYEAGAFLGRLHKAASDFIPKNAKLLPRYDDPAITLQALREAEQQFKNRIGSRQQSVLDYLKHQCNEILLHVPDEIYWSLPKLIIHGDYHPANVKYGDDGKISGVFDFDWASLQPRLRDVVDGIAYFAARRKHLFDGGDIFSLTQSCRMDMKRSLKFIKAYQTTNPAPLNEKEIRTIPYLIASRLITSRVLALRKIPEERKLAMLTNGIEKQIRWLEDNREEFISAVKKINMELY